MAGDAHATERLMREYSAGLSGFFRARRRDKAEDLVHDTLLACLCARDRLREPRALRSYTFRAARLILAREIDRRAPMHSAGSVEAIRDDPASQSQEEQLDLRQALAELPPTYAEALTLYYYGGYCAPEIADRLGVPEGTVRSRIRRGVERLRGSLVHKE